MPFLDEDYLKKHIGEVTMEDDKTIRENHDPRVTELSQKRDDVYKPLDMAKAQGFDIDKRSTLSEKSTPSRRYYLDELKRDLDEITEEIIKADSLKEILSMLNTKYAIERNILAHERNLMAEERSVLAEKMTRVSLERTELSENRSGLARMRTHFSRRNVFLAEKRSLMAQQRTSLAKGEPNGPSCAPESHW